MADLGKRQHEMALAQGREAVLHAMQTVAPHDPVGEGNRGAKACGPASICPQVQAHGSNACLPQ